MKRLSIIIPVYNSEKYVKQAIESIISSNSNDFELIIVDDGSTDLSGKICDEISRIDKRIRVLHKENDGVSNARNIGIKKASGKYVMFVDSDDLLDDGWDSIINYTNVNNDIIYFSQYIKNNLSKEEMIDLIVGNNNKNIYLGGPYCKLFKKEFLLLNNILFNNKIINGEDMLFNIKALLNCNRFTIINKSFYNYRRILESSTKRFDEKIFKSDIYYQEELKKILKESKMEKKQINNIIRHTEIGSISLIVGRITRMSPYKSSKKYFKYFENEPYVSILKKNVPRTFKEKIIFFALKKKKYRVIYFLFVLYRVKEKNRKKEIFVKI